MNPSSGLAFYPFLRLHRGKWTCAVILLRRESFAAPSYSRGDFRGEGPRLFETLISELGKFKCATSVKVKRLGALFFPSPVQRSIRRILAS